MDQYKAVITEPNRKPPEPDKYGTLTVPPRGIYFGITVEGAIAWAKNVLPNLTEGAFVTIYRIKEREILVVTKEEVISAAQAIARSRK